MTIANGTRVAFKFQIGFGVLGGPYEEGTGVVTDYGFSMRTACENTYVIRTDDGTDMHVLSYNVRKIEAPSAQEPAFVDTCIETAYGSTTRLSFQVRVF